MIVLSRYQVEPLLRARAEGRDAAALSLDLGRTTTNVKMTAHGVEPADGEPLGWSLLEEIADSPQACFEVEAGAGRKIQGFSEVTGRVYSLYPTASAPTMLVSGFPMHRIKGIDPIGDTLAKVRPILGPVRRGFERILDTCTGLGYTAIEATKHAAEVVTIELDPAAQEIARRNPWSAALFDLAAIHRMIGDAGERITTFADRSFDRIVHDPPTLSLGGELYSLDFYREAHRVLAARGRMFHYIGDPKSATGATVTKGVVRRLREAGFGRVEPRPEAFGVVASK